MKKRILSLSRWAQERGIHYTKAFRMMQDGAIDAQRFGRNWFVIEEVDIPEAPGIILTLFTHAGGAGKTSLARDLGFEMASRGQRVLLVDVDPQANLSAWFGVMEVQEEETLLGLLEKNLEPTPRPILQNLDLIPGHVELARGELLVGHLAAQQPDILFRLRYALEKQRNHYDLILVDSLPSLGSLAAIAGLAGDGLLIPVELSLKGLQALPTVFSIAGRYADSLRRMRLWSGGSFVRGIIPTGTDRTASGRHILERLSQMVDSIGAPLSPSLVRRPAVYRAAQEAGMPIQTVGNEEVVAEYKALGDWFVKAVLQPLENQEGVVASRTPRLKAGACSPRS